MNNQAIGEGKNAAYRGPGMDFGQALDALKEGARVAREGWNGKGMFLYFVPAASYPAQRNEFGTMLGMFPDDMVPYRAYIAMKTVDNDIVPWVCSQTDALADDWEIVEGTHVVGAETVPADLESATLLSQPPIVSAITENLDRSTDGIADAIEGATTKLY